MRILIVDDDSVSTELISSLLVKSGLAEAIFPGLSSKQAKLAIRVLSQLRERIDFALALAGFFAGYESEPALDKLKILKLSRNTNRHIKFLLVNRGKLLNEKMSLAELKMIVGEPYFSDLYELQRAIQKAERKSVTSLVTLRKRIKALGDVELRPKPLLDGHTLIRLGAAPGPEVGQLAQEMYIAQLEEKLQRKEQAKQWVQKWLQKHKMIEK